MKTQSGTRKVTISLDAADLRWIERRAKLVHGGNVSATFVDGLNSLRRRESLREFLRLSKAPRLSAEEVVEVLAEVRGRALSAKRRGHRAA